MNSDKFTTWKKSYTWVLISNAIYILVFYVIMQIFS
jgi:hypothetical protein